MAPVMVSAGALLSLAVLVASKPILPREEATSTEEAAAAATTDIDTEIDVTLVGTATAYPHCQDAVLVEKLQLTCLLRCSGVTMSGPIL